MKCFALILLLLTSCTAPKWQGLFVGPSLVAGFNEPATAHNLNVEATAIWAIDPKTSFQLEVIVPVLDPHQPAYRAAVARKVF